ncbi:Hypothetical protein XFF4834R_chr14690 [Xanthomonas citri pv. fuscans]|nr:Hypothetical protein XFF4834R_chr14690 [Xanthomonas citri pv. fuscans]
MFPGALTKPLGEAGLGLVSGLSQKLSRSRARCPHRLRDTPSTRPWGLDGGIHAANGPASGEDTAPDGFLAVY